MITEKQKNTIADALAEAIHESAKRKAKGMSGVDLTYYSVWLEQDGTVSMTFTSYLVPPSDRWIALDT